MKALQRLSGIGLALAGLLSAASADASPYSQVNLVSSVPGLAQFTDPVLINPWGMSFSPTSPFWLSDQGTGVSTLYRVTNGVVTKPALTVTIPTTPAPGPEGPTGQVFNNTTGFTLPTGGSPATFIFASLNGTISAWNGAQGTAAVVTATTPGAVYTGLALSNDANGARLFAVNGASGSIDAFDSSFAPISLPAGFVNPDARIANLGLVPFNAEVFNGKVYVTYAPAGRNAQISAAEGSGAVAIFDTNGNYLQTLTIGGKLASPWGLAVAPSNFGSFSGDVLVGNFSFDVSEINAYDPITGEYRGTLVDIDGNTLLNPGLWDIAFGNTSAGTNILYFNAGIQGETQGLFGSIAAIPEPEPLLLLGLGFAALALRRSRRPR